MLGRRKQELAENENEQQELIEGVRGYALEPGFYIVDRLGNLRTKEIRKRVEVNGDRHFVIIEEPIRFRTIAAAKDVLSVLPDHACLCVTAENFAWGE